MLTERLISQFALFVYMVFQALLAPLMGLASGAAFGTGYGAGVRFGYEDVYPYLKNNMGDIAKILNIPFASSGFKLASGVTAAQGNGLAGGTQDAQAKLDQTQTMGLAQPTVNAQYNNLKPAELTAVERLLPDKFKGSIVGLEKHGWTIIIKRIGQDLRVNPQDGNLYNQLKAYLP